ncbi:MAG TPA: type IV pilus biogenesis/stability protein PilW [Gammaproteobacteria bacterium]|nr:type IV pilus biogenesis/stability protein PilW [Gammaproteobacteria bacterium]
MNRSKTLCMCVALSLLVLQACKQEITKGTKPPTEQEAAVANVNLAAGYINQGRPELAIDRLQRAIKQDPKNADAQTMLGLAYDLLNSPEDAETHYKKANQLEPENSAAANSYAVFLCKHNRWKDAEPYFKHATANLKYQTPEVAYTNAGTCALNAGDRVKANENFRAALTRNPMYADALENMLNMSYEDKNYLQARAFLQRYRDVKPPTAETLWMCFDIEEHLNNHDAANRCAAQLREGFAGSPEMQKLQQYQRTNGR